MSCAIPVGLWLFSSSPQIVRHNIDNCRYNIVCIAIGHSGINRQRNQAFGDSLRFGEILVPICLPSTVIRMKVQRNKMDTGAELTRSLQVDRFAVSDAALSQYPQYLIY